MHYQTAIIHRFHDNCYATFYIYRILTIKIKNYCRIVKLLYFYSREELLGKVNIYILQKFELLPSHYLC